MGTAETCTATCTFSLIDMCANGDGCCPTGCEMATDDDCAAPPAGIGGPCVDQMACANLLMDPAATCLPAPNFPDGLCTKQCSTNTDCGSGNFCQIELNVCFPACDLKEPTCRTGYTCQQTLDVLENTVFACLPTPS